MKRNEGLYHILYIKKKKNTTFFIGTITNIEPRRNTIDILIIYLIVILIINWFKNISK